MELPDAGAFADNIDAHGLGPVLGLEDDRFFAARGFLSCEDIYAAVCSCGVSGALYWIGVQQVTGRAISQLAARTPHRDISPVDTFMRHAYVTLPPMLAPPAAVGYRT